MVRSQGKDCLATKSRIAGVIGKRRILTDDISANFIGATPHVRLERIGGVFKEDEYPKAPRKITSAARVHRPVTRRVSAILGDIFKRAPYVIHRRGKDHHQTQRPSKLSIGSPLRGPIIETTSLSAVQHRERTYNLKALSCLQIETLDYASQRHLQHLPSGARAGFFLVDDAGVGKGRTIAGLIWENWHQGRRKALWISVDSDLEFDCRRDLDDVGATSVEVHALNKLPCSKLDSKSVGIRDGVVLLTYNSLIASPEKGCSHLQQLVHWCGAEFDGLIVFDECHKESGGQLTKTCEAVLDIQARLPEARVLYCSATGASEPRNMGYMVRLGLWGDGTFFNDFGKFLGAMEKGGVGALEYVAMDMKARGMYVCRTLSFKGAEFEVVEVSLEASKMEIKPPARPISVTQQTEDSITIKEVNDVEMLEKIDEDVEMEDICADEDELVLDIDIAERKNQLAVTEYVNEIFEHYKRKEFAIPNYLVHQGDLNEEARGVLVDWLIEMHYKLSLVGETLYLCVNLLDRFLALQYVSRKNFQLVGAACLVLACKYEEHYAGVVNDVVTLNYKALCRHDILQMEKVIIQSLHFDLSLPTPYVFMKRFLRAAKNDEKLELLSIFILELCLVEYQMLGFPPSLLAAASIFTAKCTLTGNDKEWTKTLISYTGYAKEDLMECAQKMVLLHDFCVNGSSRVFYSIVKKYARSGFAAPRPAFFLLDS